MSLICDSVRPVAASCAISLRLTSSPISLTDCNSLANAFNPATACPSKYGLFRAAIAKAFSASSCTWNASVHSRITSPIFFVAAIAPTAAATYTLPADAALLIFDARPEAVPVASFIAVSSFLKSPAVFFVVFSASFSILFIS